MAELLTTKHVVPIHPVESCMFQELRSDLFGLFPDAGQEFLGALRLFGTHLGGGLEGRRD